MCRIEVIDTPPHPARPSPSQFIEPTRRLTFRSREGQMLHSPATKVDPWEHPCQPLRLGLTSWSREHFRQELDF